jgi:hypothetical protein
MTGIPGGYWGGKFVAVADPAPPPTLRGVPSRPLMKPLEYRGELLRAAQATARAEESLKAYGLDSRENYSQALRRAKFAEGVLVQRLDLADTFYWIVPATEGSLNTLAVAVDAKSGLYMQSAVRANPEVNLLQFRSGEEVAKSIIGTVVELPDGGVRVPVRREALCQYPTLVWRPCRESLSPMYPFHMFTIGSERIYVRIDGAIFTSLHTGDRGI